MQKKDNADWRTPEDRTLVLKKLLDEGSPLQRNLMLMLLNGGDDFEECGVAALHGVDSAELRRQLRLAGVRLRRAMTSQT
ncbi:MAG: hypothetical protein HY716_01805 [Planctomycetes bacterium]|nr:hypothetical protein [Planctomycetota bacterium]